MYSREWAGRLGASGSSYFQIACASSYSKRRSAFMQKKAGIPISTMEVIRGARFDSTLYHGGTQRLFCLSVAVLALFSALPAASQSPSGTPFFVRSYIGQCLDFGTTPENSQAPS